MQDEDDIDLFAEQTGDDTDDSGHSRGAARHPVTVTLIVLALLAAVAGLLIAVAAAMRAVAPQSLAWLQGVQIRRTAISSLVAVAAAVLLVIIARTVARIRSERHGAGSSAIIIAVCAVMVAGGSLLVAQLFPEGIVRPSVSDAAPINDDEQMQHDIEQIAGACTSGWQQIAVGDYPGVSAIALCTDSRVGYITFSSKAAAAIYAAPAQQKIAEVLDQRAAQANETQSPQWELLTGDQWIAVGDHAHMLALQQQWGGRLTQAS